MSIFKLLALGCSIAGVLAAESSSTERNSSSTANGNAVDKIVFENVGYTGYYYDVESYTDLTSDDCSCKLDKSFTVFEGTNAPLNEELSVHLRGPISLKGFGYYVSDDLSKGTWQRKAYYNSSSQTADNVTFLVNGGEFSPCVGRALTYASSNGTGIASSATILEDDNLVESNEEYTIMSSVKCASSGALNDCGYYREGIAAYHGFYGDIKMFLFEFEMPEATDDKDTTYHNMPAIWFLNAKIPRTSQYNANTSCSCWASGCGELDIFEVLNSTKPLQLDSTIHDFQGTDDIQNGLEATDYFERDTSGVMRGGVVFGNDRTITIFMEDSMDIKESLSASEVQQWIDYGSAMGLKSLSSVSMDTSTASASAAASGSSSSKKSDGTLSSPTSLWFSAVTLVLLSLLYL